jgi:hypothetical protein
LKCEGSISRFQEGLSMVESASVRDVPAKEKAAAKSLRPRVPTSVVVTLLGAALTVWLGPAFTRQWEDRQDARDLQAGFAEHIVVSAFRTIHDGARLAYGQGQYDVVLARWKETGLTTEVKAKAYFATPIASQWNGVVQNIEYFLFVCQDIADARKESAYARADDGTGFEYRHQRITKTLELLAPTLEQADRTARYLASDTPSERTIGLEVVKSWPFAQVSAAADELLSAHPTGFSTTRGDLLHDLIP